MSADEKKTQEKVDTKAVLDKALGRAMQGGVAGALAMGANVLTLMWMRTTVNYQYRNGTDTMTALKTLYKEGGIPRFYRGLAPALIQGPLSRFGEYFEISSLLCFALLFCCAASFCIVLVGSGCLLLILCALLFLFPHSGSLTNEINRHS